jgi:hypothetical protein
MRPSQLRKLNPQPEKTAEEIAADTIAHVFRVTVNPTQTTDSHGHRLVMLEDLADELVQAGAPLRLDQSHVDQVIFEAVSKLPADRPAVHYLYPCWKRAVHAAEHAKTPAKKALLDELRRLCHANTLFAC